MRKLKLIKSLALNLILSTLLAVGLYSCGSEDSNNGDNETGTEVIITKPDESVKNTEATKSSKTKVISRRDKELKVKSTSENAEIVEDFGDIGFEETYNFMDVDTPPMFDECNENVTKEEEESECFEKYLYKYLSKNIKYPESAKELNVEGKTYIGFVIDNTGVVSKVKVVKGSGDAYEKTEKAINEYIDAYHALDQAAIEAIKATPKTRPATVDNKPVNIQYVVPVVFKVE